MHESFILAVAERTAEVLGLEFVPEFIGFSKRNSFARKTYYNKKNVFRISSWSANENHYYRVSTIVHEVCHFVAFNHSSAFHDAERSALAAWGMEPVYVPNERYRVALMKLGTNETLWSKVTANTKLRQVRMSYGDGH